jgi:hypothetical protein
MPNFTNVELTDMVVAYGAEGGNANTVPGTVSRQSCTYIFTSTVQGLRHTGKLHPRTEDRSRDRSQILEAVEANRRTTTRRLALQVAVSHHVVWRTLKEQGLHPYHVQKVHTLQLLGKCVQREFVGVILFTDEAVWPPSSPDLNSCDFSWGHLKQLVYSQPINSVKELTR